MRASSLRDPNLPLPPPFRPRPYCPPPCEPRDPNLPLGPNHLNPFLLSPNFLSLNQAFDQKCLTKFGQLRLPVFGQLWLAKFAHVLVGGPEGRGLEGGGPENGARMVLFCFLSHQIFRLCFFFLGCFLVDLRWCLETSVYPITTHNAHLEFSCARSERTSPLSQKTRKRQVTDQTLSNHASEVRKRSKKPVSAYVSVSACQLLYSSSTFLVIVRSLMCLRLR